MIRVAYTYRAPNDRVCFGALDLVDGLTPSAEESLRVLENEVVRRDPVVRRDTLVILGWSRYYQVDDGR